MGPVLRLLAADGSPTAAARALVHAVGGVPLHLLGRARVRPASANWLRAPWYPRARGGAMTIGTTLYFTRIYFDPGGYGDGSIASTWKWMTLLTHEAGHLPQAERFGLHRWGLVRYVAAFVGQYGSRALTARRNVHDGSPLEIEADLGRWVLVQAIGAAPLSHPVVQALHAGDAEGVRGWCTAHARELQHLQQRYREQRRPGA